MQARNCTWRSTGFWLGLVLTSLAALSSHASAQSLREAVEQATTTNPEVLVTTNRRLAADQGLKQANAGYLPRVDLTAGVGPERLNSLDSRAAGLSDTTINRRDAALTLSQMLFDGFAVKSEVARQQARIDSAAYGVATTAEDIALRVIGAYLEVLRRQETVAAAIDNLNIHQRIHEQIRMRSESGVGRRADFDQAEGRLAFANANLRMEQGSLRDAQVAYLRVVGTSPRMLQKPASPAHSLPSSENLALETALANHPAIKSAEADVAGTDAQLNSARAALSPRLDLELGANSGRDAVHGRTDDVTLMLRVRYNLSRGGADQARINEAYFQLEEAREILGRTRRQVAESISLAFNAHLTSRDRLASLKRYVEAADATREAYAKQFSIGQRTLLDLLNSENEFFSARIEYLAGVYLELGSMFRVFAGMGLLLDTLEIAPPAEAAGPSRKVQR